VRYFVALDSEQAGVAVDVTELPNGGLDVRVDGRPLAVDLVRVGATASVRAGGYMFDAVVDRSLPSVSVQGGGRRWAARVESERSRSGEAAADPRRGGGSRDVSIRSPMPGRVVRVLVGPGDAVAAGQGVVVLEAMKMENEVRSPRAGVVGRVHAAPGGTVEANALLVTFARDEGA
jgi:biotin carboxyl carrier protein